MPEAVRFETGMVSAALHNGMAVGMDVYVCADLLMPPITHSSLQYLQLEAVHAGKKKKKKNTHGS
jgi:hypothetical protein